MKAPVYPYLIAAYLLSFSSLVPHECRAHFVPRNSGPRHLRGRGSAVETAQEGARNRRLIPSSFRFPDQLEWVETGSATHLRANAIPYHPGSLPILNPGPIGQAPVPPVPQFKEKEEIFPEMENNMISAVHISPYQPGSLPIMQPGPVGWAPVPPGSRLILNPGPIVPQYKEKEEIVPELPHDPSSQIHSSSAPATRVKILPFEDPIPQFSEENRKTVENLPEDLYEDYFKSRNPDTDGKHRILQRYPGKSHSSKMKRENMDCKTSKSRLLRKLE